MCEEGGFYDVVKYVLPLTKIKLNMTLRMYVHLESVYTCVFMVKLDVRNKNKKSVIILIVLI